MKRESKVREWTVRKKRKHALCDWWEKSPCVHFLLPYASFTPLSHTRMIPFLCGKVMEGDRGVRNEWEERKHAFRSTSFHYTCLSFLLIQPHIQYQLNSPDRADRRHTRKGNSGWFVSFTSFSPHSSFTRPSLRSLHYAVGKRSIFWVFVFFNFYAGFFLVRFLIILPHIFCFSLLFCHFVL